MQRVTHRLRNQSTNIYQLFSVYLSSCLPFGPCLLLRHTIYSCAFVLQILDSQCFLIWVSSISSLDNSLVLKIFAFVPIREKPIWVLVFFLCAFAFFNRFKVMGFLIKLQIRFVQYQVSFV